nr:ulp1 protease family, C-terminal catalytic domain-containing protein [Ipomoea batatas]
MGFVREACAECGVGKKVKAALARSGGSNSGDSDDDFVAPPLPFVARVQEVPMSKAPGGDLTVDEDVAIPHKDDIREMGFAALLDFNVNECPPRLVYWLLSNFDGETRVFDLGGGRSLALEERDVELVLGFPRGPIEMVKRDRVVPACRGWSLELLQQRELSEIRLGGFGHSVIELPLFDGRNVDSGAGHPQGSDDVVGGCSSQMPSREFGPQLPPCSSPDACKSSQPTFSQREDLFWGNAENTRAVEDIERAISERNEFIDVPSFSLGLTQGFNDGVCAVVDDIARDYGPMGGGLSNDIALGVPHAAVGGCGVRGPSTPDVSLGGVNTDPLPQGIGPVVGQGADFVAVVVATPLQFMRADGLYIYVCSDMY